MNAFLHWLGIDNVSGHPYAFWSGSGNVIERLIELIAIAGLYLRRNNCHSRWCFRQGKYSLEGTPWTLCRKHHPEIEKLPTPTQINSAKSTSG